MNNNAEFTRIKYLYRSKIIKKDLKLSLESAKPLIGPDCAFHLYQGHNPSQPEKKSKKPNPK